VASGVAVPLYVVTHAKPDQIASPQLAGRAGVGTLHVEEVAIGIAIEDGRRRRLHDVAVVSSSAVARDAVREANECVA
jgi:hypothetical protein